MSKSNKYYSNRQETMIAKYLGWYQVVGSGSRPFIPGDVNSCHWLGECKTHDTEKSNVVFLKRHWLKISEEAVAKRKFPILFTDNGTQLADNTWVMLPLSVFDPEIVNIIEGLKNTSTKGTSLTFNLADTKSLYRTNCVDNKYNVFSIMWEDRKLAVTPLSVFRDFCSTEFGY